MWFALTGREILSTKTKKKLERSGRIVHVYRKGFKVAACKGSFRMALLSAVKSKEGWSLWVSTAALKLQFTVDQRGVEESSRSHPRTDGVNVRSKTTCAYQPRSNLKICSSIVAIIESLSAME